MNFCCKNNIAISYICTAGKNNGVYSHGQDCVLTKLPTTTILLTLLLTLSACTNGILSTLTYTEFDCAALLAML